MPEVLRLADLNLLLTQAVSNAVRHARTAGAHECDWAVERSAGRTAWFAIDR
jgi:hypothetical protein